MKTIYVKNLEKNQVFTGEIFAIFDINRAQDKNGKTYVNLVVGDKTGKISGKIWSDKLESINNSILKVGNLGKLSGKVDDYKGVLQLNIYSIEQVDETQVDDFFASSQYDPDEMFKELNSYIHSIGDKEIKDVITDIYSDSEVQRKIKYWPAGNSIHHEFRSGLLQHLLEMLEIHKGLIRFYPDLNHDILIAGILLHDIGKIEELKGGLASNYTTIGSLIGHIVIGYEIFTRFAKGKMGENKLLHIQHLILSHHGKLEFGSPVLPSTPEAIALNHIDGLSSKTRAALKVVSEIGAGDEFSRNYPWLENAKFWSKHNHIDSTKQNALDDSGKDGDSKTEDVNNDFLKLIE